jgi:1,4-dihydroxy-6-naphthoate synthase
MLTIAYSPCPNDTFMFHDLAAGRLRLPGHDLQVHLHDVETLNHLALDGVYDVTKVSMAAWLKVREEYELLNVGAAVAWGAGPLLVAKKELSRADLPHCRVAVPGELTTAHVLLRLFFPELTDRVFVPYDQVMPLVVSGDVDCGVLIHEGRFVYQQHGLRLLADLGQWWEQETKLPIPLGGIVARRRLGEPTLRQFEALLRQAIENSLAHPEETRDYVRRHAQELDATTLDKHVKMFVNEFSLDLGETGRAAVTRLEELAARAGLLP